MLLDENSMPKTLSGLRAYWGVFFFAMLAQPLGGYFLFQDDMFLATGHVPIGLVVYTLVIVVPLAAYRMYSTKVRKRVGTDNERRVYAFTSWMLCFASGGFIVCGILIYQLPFLPTLAFSIYSAALMGMIFPRESDFESEEKEASIADAPL